MIISSFKSRYMVVTEWNYLGVRVLNIFVGLDRITGTLVHGFITGIIVFDLNHTRRPHRNA